MFSFARLRSSLLTAAVILIPVAAWAQNSDLTLELEGSVDQVQVGQQLEYVLVVTNNGPDSTASFSLVDTLPAGQQYVDSAPRANVSGNTLTFSGGTLDVGANATFRILARATAAGTQVDSATVTGASADPDATNNSAQYTLPAVPPAVTLAATTPNVVEGSGGTGQFTLTLSAPLTTDIHVGYAVKGSGLNGIDFTFLKGTAKIKAGKTTKPITVVPQGDLGGAAKKTVVLVLEHGDGYTVGTTGKVKVKILAPTQ